MSRCVLLFSILTLKGCMEISVCNMNHTLAGKRVKVDWKLEGEKTVSKTSGNILLEGEVQGCVKSESTLWFCGWPAHLGRIWSVSSSFTLDGRTFRGHVSDLMDQTSDGCRWKSSSREGLTCQSIHHNQPPHWLYPSQLPACVSECVCLFVSA